MKFLISYYNHKPENKQKLARYFEVQRENMQRVGYEDSDLMIISNEDLPGVTPFTEEPFTSYEHRYYNKYVALKQALQSGEAILMMDHDVFLLKNITYKIPKDLSMPGIYSNSLDAVYHHFSEQMVLFSAGTYRNVCRHVDSLMTGVHVKRHDPASKQRHDNCFSSEATQYNKSFYGVPLHKLFASADQLVETPENCFNTQTEKNLIDHLNNPKFTGYDSVHAHIAVKDY